MSEKEFSSFGRPTESDARRTLDDDTRRVRLADNPAVARVALVYGARRAASFVLNGVLDRLEMQSEFMDAGAMAGMHVSDVLHVVKHELVLACRRRRDRSSS